jgi:hypothetical protein
MHTQCDPIRCRPTAFGINGLPLIQGIKADSDPKGATAVGGGGGGLPLSLSLFHCAPLMLCAVWGPLVGSPSVRPRGQAPRIFRSVNQSASRSTAKPGIGAANVLGVCVAPVSCVVCGAKPNSVLNNVDALSAQAV